MTHPTFREYVADRWNLSCPRAFSLCYSARVFGVLEEAGESPTGSDSALREFHTILSQSGADATIEAFRLVAPDGVLPAAPQTRAKLIEAGHVDKPERALSDLIQQRVTSTTAR